MAQRHPVFSLHVQPLWDLVVEPTMTVLPLAMSSTSTAMTALLTTDTGICGWCVCEIYMNVAGCVKASPGVLSTCCWEYVAVDGVWSVEAPGRQE